MKPERFRQEFYRIFKRLSNDASPGRLNLEIDFYKDLWNFFVLSDSFYFILNHHSLEFEYVSQGVENILGFSREECTVELLSEQLYQEDFSWFLAFGKTIADFFGQLPVERIKKYKVRHDLRYRNRNGSNVRLLYQGIIIEHDENGCLLRSLGINTDITYLKHEGKPLLSFIGIDNEPSFVDVGSENSFDKTFTKREKQILNLLIEGRSSKEISSVLHISKQTVDTHRKNMLHKKNLSNTGELISRSIKNGWI